MIMDNNATSLTGLQVKARDIDSKTQKTPKYRFSDKPPVPVSSIAIQLAILVVVALFFTLLSIAGALWIGSLLGETFYGFFVMAGIYALAGIVAYTSRWKWLRPLLRYRVFSRLARIKRGPEPGYHLFI
jgi:hypothetical protein